MMNKFGVPRLEKLAFEASFTDLINNILLCRSHRPEQKQLPLASIPSLITNNPVLKSENIITLVRTYLNHYLTGTMNDKIRQKFVEKFYIEHLQNRLAILPDIWVLLDCVLDESFLELETHIAFPDTGPNPKLISVIANRASQLRDLKINLIGMDKETWIGTLKPVILSLSKLQYLTRMSLHHLDESYRSVLNFVGSSCPLLSYLCVSKSFVITKRDILAILLGEMIDALFPKDQGKEADWCKDGSLEQLVVPSKFLSPVCSSLRQLHLVDKDWLKGSTRRSPIGFSAATVAFALRHLHLLEKMDETVPVVKAIKILHDLRGLGESDLQEKFEAGCLEASSRLGVLSLSDPAAAKNLSIPSDVCGPFKLIDLGIVSVLHANILQLVGSKCPSLKSAIFCEKFIDRLGSLGWYKGEISPEELESILKKWPRLECITIVSVSPLFVKSILNAFGPDKLKHLTLESCLDINIVDLLVCSKLESLSILKCSTLDEDNEPSAPVSESFLPLLNSLESDICLGNQSRFFQKESSLLTRVVLNCCHIGVKVSSLRTTAPILSMIPKVWPKLEIFHIRQCPSLEMCTVMATLLPQLTNIKEICFPEDICMYELRPSYQFVEELFNQSPPIVLRFETVDLLDYQHCSLPAPDSPEVGGKRKRDENDSDTDEDLSDFDEFMDYI